MDTYRGKRLVIIGASYLQEPLILRANELGLETHVFAWEVGDRGEALASRFHPISITEVDRILDACRDLAPDGICSIASDLAAVAVGRIAHELSLPGNSPACVAASTNKHLMRRAFERSGVAAPRSRMVESPVDIAALDIALPLIVKPADRSGSRGVTKVDSAADLPEAIERALAQSFVKQAIVEEFVTGREYSIECISQHGEHRLLALTEKFTTGAPDFIETGHLEPAPVDADDRAALQGLAFAALSALDVTCGASHTEVMLTENGPVVIEVGARMGGDLIGSHLVPLSTGIDFTHAVIDAALGIPVDLAPSHTRDCAQGPGKDSSAAVRFIMNEGDLHHIEEFMRRYPETVVASEVFDRDFSDTVHDSSTRHGYCLVATDDDACIRALLA